MNNVKKDPLDAYLKDKSRKKWFITKMFEKFIWSFDNTSSGFSMRKILAFFGFALCIYITLAYTSDTNLRDMLAIWLIFILMLLGIVTAEQVLRFKEGAEVGKNPDDHSGDEPHVEVVQGGEVKPVEKCELSDEEALAQIEKARAER